MSTYTKSSSVLKKPREETPREADTGQLAEIIPFPDVQKIMAKTARKKETVRLEGKYIHYRGKKVPILHFQKSGYDKLLKLLVKEIG